MTLWCTDSVDLTSRLFILLCSAAIHPPTTTFDSMSLSRRRLSWDHCALHVVPLLLLMARRHPCTELCNRLHCRSPPQPTRAIPLYHSTWVISKIRKLYSLTRCKFLLHLLPITKFLIFSLSPSPIHLITDFPLIYKHIKGHSFPVAITKNNTSIEIQPVTQWPVLHSPLPVQTLLWSLSLIIIRHQPSDTFLPFPIYITPYLYFYLSSCSPFHRPYLQSTDCIPVFCKYMLA